MVFHTSTGYESCVLNFLRTYVVMFKLSGTISDSLKASSVCFSIRYLWRHRCTSSKTKIYHNLRIKGESFGNLLSSFIMFYL